jgi:hypothetical protein
MNLVGVRLGVLLWELFYVSSSAHLLWLIVDDSCNFSGDSSH